MKPLIAKGVSPQAKQFIQAALGVLYSVKTMPVIKQMVTGGKTLAQGAGPFVAMLMMKLQTKLGPLSPQDEPVVALHICGAIADIAKELHDPEVKNGTLKPVAQMMMVVKKMITPQQGQPQPGQPQQGGPPQGQPAPLQQLQGAPQ